MKSQLKTKKFESHSLGRTVNIREMSAKGQAALMDAKEQGLSNIESAAHVVKHGVPEFSKESVESLLENMSLDMIMELSTAVLDLSGTGEPVGTRAKNSEAGQAKNLN